MMKMKEIVNSNKPVIEKYCRDNGLDFGKIWNLPRSYSDDYFCFQDPWSDNINNGALGGAPAPVILEIFNEESGIRVKTGDGISDSYRLGI